MSYNLNGIGNQNISANRAVNTEHVTANNNVCTSPAKQHSAANIPFHGVFSDVFAISKFKTKKEKAMYNELSSTLGQADKIKFDILLNTGRLLSKDSNDGSSTLENLYKILKNPRSQGFNSNTILSETLSILTNPFTITQKFGEMPPEISKQIMDSEQHKTIYKGFGLDHKPNDPKNADDLNVEYSGCCVAASIEFNLADKKPAEFARYVAGLTSPENSVKVTMKYSDISPNLVDSLNLLNQFHVKAKSTDWQTIETTIEPDKNALIRAVSKTKPKDLPIAQTTAEAEKDAVPVERNLVDVLLQSTFMNLGSQGTYNTLTDKRYGAFNTNDKGLTEFEKNFTETIVDHDGGKTSVTYQNVDENAKLVGYNTDFNVVSSHLTQTLASGSNVIIGITEVDESKKIIGGHEITVIGTKKDEKGNLLFVCNDTDDQFSGAVEIDAKDLIPRIHHAGIPNKILNFAPPPDTGFELLKELENMNKATA